MQVVVVRSPEVGRDIKHFAFITIGILIFTKIFVDISHHIGIGLIDCFERITPFAIVTYPCTLVGCSISTHFALSLSVINTHTTTDIEPAKSIIGKRSRVHIAFSLF